MLARIRPRSAYDVMAVVALFIAVGTGGAYAANTIGSGDVIDESLLSRDIQDGQVANSDLAPDSVTGSKLRAASVANSELVTDSVTTSKIRAENVANSELATDAVTARKIRAAAVENSELAPDAVTGPKVLADALTGADVLESSLGKVPDADTLDGFDWTAFLQANGKAADAELLDGSDSADFLGATATAADSDLLDGLDANRFARLGGFVLGDGSISQGTGFTVSRLSDGEYQVSFPPGTLPNPSCPIPTAMVFSGLVRHAQISTRTCSGLGAGSFTVKTLDNDAVPRDTAFFFIAM